MDITKDSVVEFRYSLVDENGDAVNGAEPQTTAVLYGHRSVIRGVEQALHGRTAGDRFVVTVPPEEGYGMRKDDWTQRVSKKYFANPRQLKPGAIVQMQTDHGSRPVTVIKVGGKVVDVDLNHPHAGVTLRFDVEILDVREPTGEELSHGHAHGHHGAHH